MKSKFLAIMLTLGTAAALTLAHSIASPSPAEAGVVSSIKGAAKTVGRTVVNRAEGIGAAGRAAGAVGRQVGVGMYYTVKPGAVAVYRTVKPGVVAVSRDLRRRF